MGIFNISKDFCPNASLSIRHYIQLDWTVRSYCLTGEQLTPRHTLPAITGKPWQIVVDAHRPAVLVIMRSNRVEEVSMLVLDADGWTAWRTLARDDSQYTLDIRALCMIAPNSLALFDQNSNSMKLYELL